MDSDQDCTKSIRNDGMDQEDYYQVDSDSNDGRDAQSMQRPAECGIGFNFGDRLIGQWISLYIKPLKRSNTFV